MRVFATHLNVQFAQLRGPNTFHKFFQKKITLQLPSCEKFDKGYIQLSSCEKFGKGYIQLPSCEKFDKGYIKEPSPYLSCFDRSGEIYDFHCLNVSFVMFGQSLASFLDAWAWAIENDETTNDSFFYVSKFGRYLQKIDRGGLKIPGFSISQWFIRFYVKLFERAFLTCRSMFSNSAMITFDMYNFNIERYHFRINTNILCNSFRKLHSPHLCQEPNQKLLKLSC